MLSQLVIQNINLYIVVAAFIKAIVLIITTANRFSSNSYINWTNLGDSTKHPVTIALCRMKHMISFVPNENMDIKLYPNPTTGKVTMLYHLTKSKGILQFYDVAGRQLKSYSINGKNNEFEFDIEDLCCGILEYKVIDGQSLAGRGKIVILK